MASSPKRVESLLKSAFPIQVAVRSTEAVEQICSKNNLRFFELLKPFCHLSNNVQLKDVQGHLYYLKNVRLRFSEPPAEPIPESKLRILLGETVHNSTSIPAGSLHIGDVSTVAATPWFDAYRDTYLDFLKQSDHEPVKHYVSVIFVVSSTSQEPLEEFSQLYMKQKQSEQSKYPKWLSPHLYYYHVLLHDIAGGIVDYKRAQESYSLVKRTYGDSNCYMLQVNSIPLSVSPSKFTSGSDLWSNMTTSVMGQDEVDSPFGKLRLPRSSTKKNSNGPIPGNTLPEDRLSDLAHGIKISRIQAEPQLVGSDSTTFESTQNSSTASTVKPGDDPLSQFAATNWFPRGNGSMDTVSNVHGESGLLNPMDLMGVKRDGVQYGRCLSDGDHQSLKGFVVELATKKLLPHLNEVLKNLNELLLSRRSVRRSFSNMLKGIPKIFGTPNNVVTEEQNYAYNSMEMQLRQFADIAFLLQSYDLAFQSYHQVKKDFRSANMCLYYAGAVEMCAVTSYLISAPRTEVISYLEKAISVYNLSCKILYYTIRSSLMLVSVFQERGMYKELTQLCVRLTAEDADLHSAVCVEQAAYGFLKSKPSMPRKYALHLVLAGNRYARAAQRLHSLRAYQQALEVYQGKGWTLAEDYVHFCLAKHSFSIHNLSFAKAAFHNLLSHESVQSPTLQRLHLQDYVYVCKQLLLADDSSSSLPSEIKLTTPTTSQSCVSNVGGIPLLPLPFVKSQSTRVTFITAPSDESLNKPYSLDKDFLIKNRSSSVDGCPSPLSRLIGAIDDLQVDNVLSLKMRSASTSVDGRTIRHYLQQLESSSWGSTSNILVGMQDYDPSRGVNGGEEDMVKWAELEMQAAVGMHGALHENFVQSVQVVDHQTHNSQMHFTVVKESVGVGVVLKNPLKGVPLLLTNLCLVWDATPTKRHSSVSMETTVSSPAAVCDVVKQVLLQPEQEKMVTLHITPLREGELVVTGFLFNLCVYAAATASSASGLLSPPTHAISKANSLTFSLSSRDILYQVHQGSDFQALLSEGVQGRVEFDVCGSRLNGSKLEKSSKTYSKDHRLHWKVTSPMPKVVAVLRGVPGSLLTGEVVRVGVEVYNVGQVALNSLRISSSLGSRLLLDTVTSELYHPVYHSTLLSPLLIPSATTSPLSPITSTPFPPGTFSPNCLELPLPQGRLEVGKGVLANLIMQGVPPSTISGDHDVPWNMVFYYEPVLISANSRLSHRVMRHSCMLHVRESLQLRAMVVHSQLLTASTASSDNTSMPTCTLDNQTTQRLDLNQLVVTLEAENMCELAGSSSSAMELRVSQISCASPKWRLSKLDRQQGLLCLLPRENGVIHLKGARVRPLSMLGSAERQGSVGGELVYSDVPLGPTLIPSSSFPVPELVRGSNVLSQLDSPDFSPASGGGRRRGRSSSDPEEEMSLVVFWQALLSSGAGTDTVFSYGHHMVSVPLPQSMAALREFSPSPYDLVKFHLEHPTSYRCRSSPGSTSIGMATSMAMPMTMCRIPVKITLHNCCHQKVKVVVELLQPRDGAQPDSNRFLELGFFWTGGSRRQFQLEPNSSHTLSVLANFCWPGVYNLNSMKVAASWGDRDRYHTQRWQRTSYITVEQ